MKVNCQKQKYIWNVVTVLLMNS